MNDGPNVPATILVLLGVVSLAAGWARAASAGGEVNLGYAIRSAKVRFGAERLTAALADLGMAVKVHDLAALPARVDVLVTAGDKQAAPGATIAPEGYRIAWAGPAGSSTLAVTARDEVGAMYGLLDVSEQVRMTGRLAAVEPRAAAPRMDFRAIKFNLPWSPYREGKAMDVNVATCRDLAFWQRFIDMMAENRYNALTLWNVHPFTYMVRPKGYAEACSFSDAELAEWQKFWRALFAMARDRGIETYVVNWNIEVSPEFAKARGVKQKNDTGDLVRRYTRQCVAQVIDEYPDLTGLGITLADWMKDMTPAERSDWTIDTFVAGMKDAHRPIKFIFRSVLTASAEESRRIIDACALKDPVWMEIKFNWSHAFSTPRLSITHDFETGKVDDRFWNPPPKNYRIAWMIRNEDIFILRWGDPEFVRAHIAANTPEYVGGYFVGSESFIPAADTSHKPGGHMTWRYAFEKQWLLWRLWGRLLYDPATPDAVLAAPFDERYGRGTGAAMLRAYMLASRMPERLASFYSGTWDFALYSEGLLAPYPANGLDDKLSPFISINELIEHRTLDRTYVSIPDYVSRTARGEAMSAGAVTPPKLADDCDNDAAAVLDAVRELRALPARADAQPAGPGASGAAASRGAAMECELADLETWAHLSRYFAVKLRAGVALETFRRAGAEAEKARAVDLLKQALVEWERVVAIADAHLVESPYMGTGTFSWRQYLPEVRRDIDLARASVAVQK